MLSCYVVLLSCLRSFVVLPVLFYNGFTILHVFCLTFAPFSLSLVLFLHGPVWLWVVMSCFALVYFGAGGRLGWTGGRAGGRSVGRAVGRSSGGRSGGGAGRRSAGVRADGRAGVVFSPRFLRVVFCKSFFLSRRSALRVSPAETRLTVYRRLSITLFSSKRNRLRGDRPSSGVREGR